MLIGQRKYSKNNSNRTKFAHEALPNKWSPVFFGKTRHAATVPVAQLRTINFEWYTTCLPAVFQEIRKTNRRRWIILQHDNASSHTLAQTTIRWVWNSIVLMWYEWLLYIPVRWKRRILLNTVSFIEKFLPRNENMKVIKNFCINKYMNLLW